MNLGGAEKRKMDSKLLKPLVEKRRRERINKSLENLRTLLLQNPQHQQVTQRRLEKSEILEHTVLFLKNTCDSDRKTAEGRKQQSPFQDGMSACLERGLHFLGHDREGVRLEEALNNILSSGLNSHACVSTKVLAKAHPSNSSPRTSDRQFSSLRTIQESHTKPQLSALSGYMSHSHRASLQQTHRDTEKEAHSQNFSTSRSVWRPWP
ncbi:hypothetical protein DPEC_G00239350 [Dallia pectoralis]|uniref:Uncharacterized protein n=1 Tax=Dallia pectoralis TaxID=75939 RepID=A0ACC2FZE2_DALPE|nr:hypothetical protein DPEC_G00239350 [Dallia pectoralis]